MLFASKEMRYHIARPIRGRAYLLYLGRGVLAYKRAKPQLLAWLERCQIRIDSYGPNGVARNRDREAYEAEFADHDGSGEE